MTYIELYDKAINMFARNEIALGEYMKMIEPLNQEICEWIPCSERLPSEYGEYLATVDGEAIEVSYVPKNSYQWLVKGWSTCEADGYKKLSDDEVIAWMPLPEPYKRTYEYDNIRLVADEKEKEHLDRTFPHDCDGEWYDLTDMMNKGE